jgi:hypothetical protein
MAIPPEAIARAIAFAIEQPADVDVNEIIIRPTAQAYGDLSRASSDQTSAAKRAQGTNRTSTIACRPGLVTIKSQAPAQIQVSGSIHCPSGHEAAV